MTNVLQDLADDKTLNEYHKLALAIIILNRELPLIWEDKVVDPAWMRSNPKLAVAMLDSSLPTWLHKLRNENWMVELQQRRKEIWKALQPSPTQSAPLVNLELAEQLILGLPEVAHSQAKATKEATFNSQIPTIDQALKKTELTDGEAILLAACDRTLLWSKEQEQPRQAEEEERRRRAAIAESERQKSLLIQERERRKQQSRQNRFNLANALGWASLATAVIWPLFPLGVIMCVASVYFILDFKCHSSSRTELKGGHRVAWGVTILTPIVICIALAVSAATEASRSRATTERQALEKRANEEPTSFLWRLFSYESENEIPREKSFQMALANDRLIIDKAAPSEFLFHAFDSYDHVWIWSWTQATGGRVTSTQEYENQIREETFNIYYRDPDKVSWSSYDSAGSHHWYYYMILRNSPGLRVFQPFGWKLYRRSVSKPDGWHLFSTLNDQDQRTNPLLRADVSSSAITLSWPVNETNIFHQRGGVSTMSWRRDQNTGFAKTEWIGKDVQLFGSNDKNQKEQETSNTDELKVDVEHSSFVNGPIYMTETEPNGKVWSYILVRY
jgi:hypothetical protein